MYSFISSPFAFLTFLVTALLSGPMKAAVVFYITESGGTVRVSGAGTLNIAALSLRGTSNSSSGINSTGSFLEVSTGSAALYNFVSGPASFGTGSFTAPSSQSGDRFGIRFGASSVVVPVGYLSGAPLSGTMEFAGKSLANLGLTPGSYTWTWGSGTNADSLTINVWKQQTSPGASFTIDASKNPVLQWQAEPRRRYSILYSTDLKKFTPIAKGFPFGGAKVPDLQFNDSEIFTDVTPKAFYKIEANPVNTPDSAAELDAFFVANGGRQSFEAYETKALEALLFAQDEIEAGQLVEARARIDELLTAYPLTSPVWKNDAKKVGLTLGNPPGYAGIRMLDQILEEENPSRKGTLRMTALVAPSAAVTRPKSPPLTPGAPLTFETVTRPIDPQILADSARRLHLVSSLSRRWLQAITGGLDVELVVHQLSQPTTVEFNNYSTRPSIATLRAMTASVPASIAESTDIWWVIYPSGVPGDGSGYPETFVSGGITEDNGGRPLIISDDAWFIRKPSNKGSGPYSDVELRAYIPQWFQHEIMHAVFWTWPEFNLEDTSHKWFNRALWPSDFVGQWEPDYYSEALTERLLPLEDTVRSLANVLRYEGADMEGFPVEKLLGNYTRFPVENDYHRVTIKREGGSLRWTIGDNSSWGLEIMGSKLWSQTSSIGGAAQPYPVLLDGSGNVIAIRRDGQNYVRNGTPPAPTMIYPTVTLPASSQSIIGCSGCAHHPISK